LSSIREQLIVAAVAALSAATITKVDGVTVVTKPAGLSVHRERTRPIEIDSLPAIMVYSEDDPPKTLGTQVYRAPLTEHQLTVALELRAQGSAGVSPDAALDPLYVWAILALGADVSFGGLASEVEEGRMTWNSHEGDVPVVAAKLQINIRYRTSRLDPTSKS
jgi:hypothetical protein